LINQKAKFMRKIDEADFKSRCSWHFPFIKDSDIFKKNYKVIPELESAECLVLGAASEYDYERDGYADHRSDVDLLRFLNRLFPELEIAVRVQLNNIITFHYSPKGVVSLNPCCKFPDVDWIPKSWSNATLVPYSRMKVYVVPLGQWDAEETEVLNNVLLGDELIKAMGYLHAEEPVLVEDPSSIKAPIVLRDGYFVNDSDFIEDSNCDEDSDGEEIDFFKETAWNEATSFIYDIISANSCASYLLKMVGQSYLVEDLDYLDLILSDYRELKEPFYSSFCKTMLKKKHNIFLELNVQSNPDSYGSYCSRYNGSYMLSSDGKRLIATALQNGKKLYSAKLKTISLLYKYFTGNEFKDLPPAIQHITKRELLSFLQAVPSMHWNDATCDGTLKYGYFDEYSNAVDEFVLNIVGSYFFDHRDELMAIIKTASHAKSWPMPSHFVPQYASKKFNGLYFFIIGHLRGYTNYQAKCIIEKLGGKVTSIDVASYCLYGEDVKRPFFLALHRGMTLLSSEHFEDMTMQ
jgi:hypothetical protein